MARTRTKSASENAFDFEAALAELNGLVEQMEQGGLTLEDSLKSFEKGVVLTRACQEALKAAEQKVKILTTQNGQPTLTSFEEDPEA